MSERLHPCIRRFDVVSTLLSRSARLCPKRHVSSRQGNSREQSCAVAPCSGGGCAVPISCQVSRQAPCRGRVTHPGDTRMGRRTAAYRPRSGHRPAMNRPCVTLRRATPRPSARCRSISESSCGTPMHPPALTKGYGGNPPSGRSVSPPRTGPFSCPPTGGGVAPVAPNSPPTHPESCPWAPRG